MLIEKGSFIPRKAQHGNLRQLKKFPPLRNLLEGPFVGTFGQAE
jgi:hypothetical protein